MANFLKLRVPGSRFANKHPAFMEMTPHVPKVTLEFQGIKKPLIG